MTASDATLAERAAAPSRSVEGDGPPDAQMRAGPLTIRHLGREPCVHPDAYVAPTAVLSGQVSIGPGSCVLHGAVLAAEGGPVQVGAGNRPPADALQGLREWRQQSASGGGLARAGPDAAMLLGNTRTYAVVPVWRPL
jgi:hypothetical protein